MLKDGKWDEDFHPIQSKDEDGRFVRQTSSFRDWITKDGGAGPECQQAFPAEKGRYHLYVGYICPWASRTLMVRKLKKLEDIISVSVTEPVLTEQGWRFGSFSGSTEIDPHIGATYMHELYTHADHKFTGRATVPVLWDKNRNTIINNESADIIRILNRAFNDLGDASVDLRPQTLIDEINELNDYLYVNLNNGVYKSGFASSQFAYEEAVTAVFSTLDTLEQRLSDGRSFLCGENLTEPDLRMFATLIRFDAAYVGLFKCNLRRIADYPYLNAFTHRMLAIPEIGDTVHIDHIKAGYYSIKALNPLGIIPIGPERADA